MPENNNAKDRTVSATVIEQHCALQRQTHLTSESGRLGFTPGPRFGETVRKPDSD